MNHKGLRINLLKREKTRRGRMARHPSQIPLLGWCDIILRVYFKLDSANISILSAGVAFYAMLAIFPALALVVALPAVNELFHLPKILHGAVQALGWPLLAAVIMFALAILYRLAPPRRGAKWRWVSWGSVVATLLWLGGSGLFSYYVASFASYDEMYGSLGAIIILLLWFFLTTYAILLGAALNAEMELQTVVDSTHGPERPMGQRGAYVADNLGEKPSINA